jgi:alkanesulfonate monooxygenase SsuD/methylene tetrahydromethanopterin reductase-like flavin-dependent oxidoreductase (luciferase family)
MPKFSLEIGVSLDSLETVSTKAEELGFDGIFYGDSLSSYRLECWTALAIISSYTKSIRLGPAVTFPLIRHPSILARAAATIDQFSNGRLEFRVGLGGKTMRSDSKKYGFEFATYENRVKILDESLQIMKSLWSNKETNFSGEYFNLSGASQEIIPVQKNGPPITISGKSDSVLELLERHGDVWEAGGRKDDNYESLVQKVDGIRSRSNKPKIDKSIELFVLIDKDGGESSSGFEGLDGWNLFNGSADYVCENMQAMLDAGFNRFSLYFVEKNGSPFRQTEANLVEQMELFRDKVIPNLRI